MIATITNRQYNVASPGSAPQRVTARMRRQMYERFLAATDIKSHETILDVGATSDQLYDFSNYLEAWYPHKSKITATGIDDAAFLEVLYPGLVFKKADGRDLPFPDGSFDVVHSSAVLEHVGSRANQEKFLSELVRVARRVLFITTPNRWFPIEVHTVLPFVHWLPPEAFRAILTWLGHDTLSREEHLNLLGATDIRRLCRRIGVMSQEISSVRLLGISSNLLLTIRKERVV
jgi:hypothetical protein